RLVPFVQALGRPGQYSYYHVAPLVLYVAEASPLHNNLRPAVGRLPQLDTDLSALYGAHGECPALYEVCHVKEHVSYQVLPLPSVQVVLGGLHGHDEVAPVPAVRRVSPPL